MDLEKDDFRTVLEDARVRHAALVTLLYATDQQAMALLRFCSTMGVAAASGALAGWTGSELISRPFAWVLASATILFTLGAALCLKSLRPMRINLPGRNAEFWQWALRPDVDRRAALDAYLSTLQQKRSTNSEANRLSAAALEWAKYCVAAAPFISLMTGLAAFRFGF